ncbi:hypothetical protein PAPYR_12039 [Paratrimastix pyriformis]|uniref:Uncharacterized protein n=1 Tax=Paratrimastix pyriformis TaxID=342808 RepID=A0ABQ8U821_9EUKA|nr:hypothetical protein PAPYR_12039 [Paratrimastix pyriformis]
MHRVRDMTRLRNGLLYPVIAGHVARPLLAEVTRLLAQGGSRPGAHLAVILLHDVNLLALLSHHGSPLPRMGAWMQFQMRGVVGGAGVGVGAAGALSTIGGASHHHQHQHQDRGGRVLAPRVELIAAVAQFARPLRACMGLKELADKAAT